MKLPYRITAPSLPLAVVLLLLGSTAWAVDRKLTSEAHTGGEIRAQPTP